jgi:hypothetical protein
MAQNGRPGDLWAFLDHKKWETTTMATYRIQRLDDERFLTSQYLRWSVNKGDAQRCDSSEEAEGIIKTWLATIGIRVAVCTEAPTDK